MPSLEALVQGQQLVVLATGSATLEFHEWMQNVVTRDGEVGQPTDVPASSTAPGTIGQWAHDSNYEYRCYAENQWYRIAKSTWT